MAAKTLKAPDLSSGPHGPSEAPAQAACTPGPRRAGRSPRIGRERETTRRLTNKILETCGPTLADETTLLVLDWFGGHGRGRVTVAGADPSRASAPGTLFCPRPRPGGQGHLHR